MTTTLDLQEALAEIERKAAEAGESFEDNDADEHRRSLAEAAASHEAAIEAALETLVEEALDVTVGRFQVAQQNPRTVPTFMSVARTELRSLLKRGSAVINDVTRAKRKEAAKQRARAVAISTGDDDGRTSPPATAEENDASAGEVDDFGREGMYAQLVALQDERDVFRSERDKLQSAEHFLRSLGVELIGDVTTKTQQLQVLQGVVRRRDALLSKQRRAFLRELTHLRSIITQWETKGFATTNDASFFSWDEELDTGALAADEDRDAVMQAVAEERAKFEKEMDSTTERFAKTEEDLRRQVAVLEQQLRQAKVVMPPPTMDAEAMTDPPEEPPATLEEGMQTDDVTILLEGEVAAQAVKTPVDMTDAAPLELTAVVDVVSCPSCTGKFRVDANAVATTATAAAAATPPKRRPGSSKGPSRRTSSTPNSARKRTPLDDSVVSTDDGRSPPPALPPQPAATSTVSEEDVERLRTALEEQRRLNAALQERIGGKEAALAANAAKRLENDESRRRAEQTAIRKLQDEVRTKDMLLEKKSKELTQLQDETRRWFAQYQESLPSDHAPVNHAVLRRMEEAVSSAEASEEQYRVASWELLALDLRARSRLEGLQRDCSMAEASGDIAELRSCQRAYDTVAHLHRQKCQRARNVRLRLREEANRLWDVVLYYARSVHHAEEPLAPPPRYYAVHAGDDGRVSPNALPSSPSSRRVELENVMLHHSAAAERAAAGKHQVMNLGPVVVEKPSRPATAGPAPRPRTAGVSRASNGTGSRRGSGATFAGKLRVEVQGVNAASLGQKIPADQPAAAARSSAPDTPASRVPSGTLSNEQAEGPKTAGPASRPWTATVRRPGFNPTEFSRLPMAERRAALVGLMRHDQDMLAVTKRRHVDDMHRTRHARNAAPESKTPGYNQHRLIGRNESVPGELVGPRSAVSSAAI